MARRHPPPHNGLVSGGDLSNVVKRNGDITTYAGNGTIDHIYVTPAARDRLSNPTSFVIRPEYYGESGEDFRATYSDHLPVFVDLSITALTPRQNWRRTNFGIADNNGDGADTSDFDGDGLPNLLEYALDLHPREPSVTGLPSAGENGGNLTLTYQKDTAKTDISYQVEASDSLTGWLPLSDELISTNGSVETRRAGVPMNAARKFLRLKITPLF